MGELIKLFIEWARREKHWPLILLIAVFPAFGFSQLFFELKFRDTVGHWSFWIAGGVIFTISGLLDWAIMYRRWRRLFLSGPVAIVGIVFAVVGVIGCLGDQKIPQLPEDKLVVTIANFTSDDVDVTRLLRDMLLVKQREGAPLKLNKIGKEIAGADDDEKRENAKLLGKSKESHAHVVLWGELIKVIEGENRKFRVPGGLTVANEWQRADVEGALARFSPEIPFTICSNSTQEITDRLAEIVTIILGVAHYRVQKWDEAARILQTVRSGDGRLYAGLCYYQKAQQPSDKREEYLLAAIGVYQDLLDGIERDDRMIGYRVNCDPDNPVQQQREKNRLRGTAYFRLADADLSMGRLLNSTEALTYLQNATQNYRTALNTDPEIASRWAAENNLGVALYELAKMSDGNRMTQYVQQAVDIYQNAVNDCARREDQEEAGRDLALVHNNLGSALAYWSARASGQEKKDHLEGAEKELKAARNFFNQERPSKQWAMVETNYANVLVETGKQIPIEQGDNGDLSKAVESYEAVLVVYDREKEPEKHATIQNNLGTALYELWKRKQIEKDLQGALAAFRTAVEIRDSIGPPPSLANSKHGLAKILTEIGSRPEGARQAEYLDEAIRVFDEALLFYDQATYPQKHQEILAERATAVSAMQHLTNLPHH